MTIEFWYMLPVAALIATVAMASGVEGATFFAPLFILGLGLSTEVAIGTGLITEVFGFASGLFAYVRKRLIDYRLGMALLIVTVPAAFLGTWIGGQVEPGILKAILAVGLFAVALSFLRSPEASDRERMDAAIDEMWEDPETCLVSAEGKEHCYTVCNRTEGRTIAGVGALFMGMISTGLGEMNGYYLLQRCRVPSAVAVATSVFVVAVTALAGSAGHVAKFAQGDPEAIQTALNLTVFTVPGVLIGGQLGSAAAHRVPQKMLETGLGVLFILIAILMLGSVTT
ncbi:MAG: sulfite exporter TauE/SafE family protein [Candidatus Bipolaricaulia bacterium]